MGMPPLNVSIIINHSCAHYYFQALSAGWPGQRSSFRPPRQASSERLRYFAGTQKSGHWKAGPFRVPGSRGPERGGLPESLTLTPCLLVNGGVAPDGDAQ